MRDPDGPRKQFLMQLPPAATDLRLAVESAHVALAAAECEEGEMAKLLQEALEAVNRLRTSVHRHLDG